MKRFCCVARTAALGTIVLSQAALAHGPVFDCYLKQDDWVKCEAGFTDGSSAAGRKVHVQDASGKVLLDGSVGADSTYGFKPPAGDYSVVFLGGDGHGVTIQSSDITR